MAGGPFLSSMETEGSVRRSARAVEQTIDHPICDSPLVWVLVVLGHGRRIKSAVLTTIEAGDSVDLEGQNTAFTTLAIAMVSPQLVAISTA